MFTLASSIQCSAIKCVEMEPSESGQIEYENEYDYVLDLATNCDLKIVAASLSSLGLGIYDSSTLQATSKLEGVHSSRINSIEFLRYNPNMLISSSDDRHVRMWDLRADHRAGPAWDIFASDEVMSATIGHNDALLACAVGASVHFYDVRNSGASSSPLSSSSWSTAAGKLGEYADVHNDTINQLQFNPERHAELTSGSEDGLICTFNTAVNEGEEAILSIVNTECPVRRFGYFGPQLEGVYCLSTVESASFWHPSSAQRIGYFPDIREHLGIDYLVDCLYSAADDRLLLVGGNHDGNGQVVAVSPVDLKVVGKFGAGHSATIRSVVRGPGDIGSQLISGGEDSKLCAWQWSAVDVAAKNIGIGRERGSPRPTPHSKNGGKGKTKFNKGQSQFNPY